MESETRKLRYWNGNGGAVAIIAVVNKLDNGRIFDWAVYIGAGPSEHEADCVAYVAEHGDKLSDIDAVHFAPDLPISRYRD